MSDTFTRTPSARHWFLLGILVVCWGSAIILTRVAVSDIPPLWVTAGRLTTGAIALVTYRILAIKTPWSLTWQHAPWILLLAMLSSAIPFLLIAWGTQYTSSAIAGILMGTVPLSVLALAHLFLPDEKLTRGKAIGFLIGFVGVILIIKPDAAIFGTDNSMELIGQLAIFIASFCYALNSVATRRMPSADNIDKATAVVTTASVILLSSCFLFEPFTNLSEVSPSSWIILLYLGLIPTALASLILFILLSQTTSTFVTTSNYLIPIFTALGGIFFLNEKLTVTVWAGFGIIMLGLAISERKRATP